MRTGLLTIAVLYVVLAVMPIFGTPAQKSDDELRQDIAKLDSFLSNRNLDAIEATVDKESAKWQEKDRPSFILYMTKACSLLSSYNIGEISRRASLLSRYAISVLTSGDLPLHDNVQFVGFLMFDPLAIDEAAWTTLRKQKAELWLATWRRVESAIDPTFNFDDQPQLNVPTPPGSRLPSGSSPEFIKDPKLRAEY